MSIASDNFEAMHLSEESSGEEEDRGNVEDRGRFVRNGFGRISTVSSKSVGGAENFKVNQLQGLKLVKKSISRLWRRSYHHYHYHYQAVEEITISRSVKRAPSARFKRQIKSDSIGVTPKSCSSIVFIINEDTDQQYTRHTLHRGGKNSVKIAVSSGAGGVVTSGSVTSR